MKLLRNLATGALAGVVGTAAMDLLLYERYRRHGETSEAPAVRQPDRGPSQEHHRESAARAVHDSRLRRAPAHMSGTPCVLLDEHTENHADGPTGGRPRQLRQSPPRQGTHTGVRPAFGARLPSDGQVARCTLMS